MTTPAARSLRYLRQLGYRAESVARWVPRAQRRRHLYGFADIVATRMESPELMALQVTTSRNAAARLRKVMTEPRLRLWLRLPAHTFEVWAWAKRARAGKRKVWVLTRRAVLSQELYPPGKAPAMLGERTDDGTACPGPPSPTKGRSNR